jgi:hypothetical protein
VSFARCFGSYVLSSEGLTKVNYRSAIVGTLSKKLLDFDFPDAALKSMLELVHGYLETRVNIIQARKVILDAHYANQIPVLTFSYRITH